MDENHNVKIADFGLSNFMSDGNFLKTSCGKDCLNYFKRLNDPSDADVKSYV